MDKSIEENNNLYDIANKVLKKYDIVPEEISIIQSGTIKTVWKIKTEKGILCLKRLKQSYEKALFSTSAQIHIYNSGGNVPAIITNNENSAISEHNDEIFVIYEWLEGKDLNFSNNEDLSLAINGLAKFHHYSKGYKPNKESRISSKSGKWPNQYNSMKNRIISWKDISKEKTDSCYAVYANSADSIIEIADTALELLNQSEYKKLTSEDSDSLVLCHQDYGKGNAILTENGVYVLDLDGVTFDLPARDLRKIIGKDAENSGKWDKSNILKILNWYTENPMTDEEKKVLYIDLLFPHWFFGLTKNLFQKNKILKAREIERISKLEEAKVQVLLNLIKEGD